jgi:hypothetical protein
MVQADGAVYCLLRLTAGAPARPAAGSSGGGRGGERGPRLHLRIDAQREAAGARGEDAVLDGQLVRRQALGRPLRHLVLAREEGFQPARGAARRARFAGARALRPQAAVLGGAVTGQRMNLPNTMWPVTSLCAQCRKDVSLSPAGAGARAGRAP